MRPLRLVLEGFTSFRERIELDFAGLDLFAVTGPTGAGKSSLIDALVFALYGQVPRVGDDYKQLISHGAERLSVLFEFGVGPERYRIARSARRSNASEQRLEQQAAAGWEAVADRAREIRAQVDRILGLDYDGFTRSVVLPQGQFDAFLKGEPKERRKILVALLGLDVYEGMLQLANQKAARLRGEAEFIRRQLETDYAGATPEVLAQRRAELASAGAGAQQAAAALAALAEGARLAQAARDARREAEAAARDEAEEQKKLVAAQATLEGAGARHAALEADLDRIRRQLASLGFDESRHTLLVTAQPRAEQLAELRPRRDRAARAVGDKRRALEEARARLASAEAGLPALEQAEAEARQREAAARAGKEAAHRQHAAAALRRELKPGEACPVCAQPVKTVPVAESPALASVEARVREAEAQARAALERLQEERLRLGRSATSVEGLGRELAQLEEQQRETGASVEAAVAALARAGFPAAESGDASALLERLRAERRRLEEARRARVELDARREDLERKARGLETEVAAARAARDGAHARLEALGARRGAAARRLEAARAALGERAARAGWPGLEGPAPGRDEADVLEDLRAAAQGAFSAGAVRVATLEQAVARVEQDLVRVAELKAKRAVLDEDGALHKTLADHLRADELVAWIQEEALRRLALEGSRHLARLSQGRYELRLGSGAKEKEKGREKAARAEQEFFVVDRWNGDSVRSVKTLSGGETFLAALALALALAESLAQLSAAGRVPDALESLFLDEGFGTLDGESLEVVVSALDALYGGQRLVGIVTHVRELADRLPARVEVRRQGSTAIATIV